MPSDLRTLISTSYPHHLYFYLHYLHQTIYENTVSNSVSWKITLAQIASSPDNHYHLQWYSTNLWLYEIYLYLQLTLHQQYSMWTIVIASWMYHIVNQPGYLKLIIWPSSIRKDLQNQVKFWLIFLSFPYSILCNLLLLSTKCETDYSFGSLNWMMLLRFQSLHCSCYW